MITKWGEAHVLNEKSETIMVLSANCTYNQFSKLAEKDHGGSAMAYVTYKVIGDCKTFAVRCVLYK